MFEPISFFVAGTPKPAGSKRAFALKKAGQFTGRVVVTDDCKGSKDWKTDVRNAAPKRTALIDAPIRLTLTFLLVRPKGHYRTGKNAALLREGAPTVPTTKPDVLKLARGVEDALTGIIWRDDSLIVTETLRKRFSTRPGVEVEIHEEAV